METNKPLYQITDRHVNYSDSISRYIIDISKNLCAYYNTCICTTNEKENSAISENFLGTLPILNKLPEIEKKAIYHFHLTFSTRKHTEFLLKNIQALKSNSIITFHVDPKYGKLLHGIKAVEEILQPIIKYGIPIYVFSNYSKSNFQNEGITNIWTIYPGLDLSVYKKFQINSQKENNIIFLASNPNNTFVQECKNGKLIPFIEGKLNNYKIESCINLSFEQYLSKLQKARFYLAIGEYEHYGFAIIDAFNLGAIPIFVNNGGLSESVYNRGIPIYLKAGDIYALQSKLKYNTEMAKSNYKYSSLAHDIDLHVKQVIALYKAVIK